MLCLEILAVVCTHIKAQGHKVSEFVLLAVYA